MVGNAIKHHCSCIQAPNEDSFAFRTQFEDWEKLGCKVITTTGSFQEAFDDDDTLVYEPEESAAVILGELSWRLLKHLRSCETEVVVCPMGVKS